VSADDQHLITACLEGRRSALGSWSVVIRKSVQHGICLVGNAKDAQMWYKTHFECVPILLGSKGTRCFFTCFTGSPSIPPSP